MGLLSRSAEDDGGSLKQWNDNHGTYGMGALPMA